MRDLFFGVMLLLTLSLISCQAEKEGTWIPFDQVFLDRLSHQGASERKFVDVSYQKAFTITSTTDFEFYNISEVVVSQDGFIHVLDHGITKTHRFSPSGEYLMTYGYGFGEGPGELLTLINFGIKSDSMVYMMDSAGRKISFYSMDGTFLKSKSYDDQIYRYTQTLYGREYIFSVNPPTLIETRLGNDKTPIVRFSDLTSDLESDVVQGLWRTVGPIIPYGENLVYVLERHPLLIQYASDGSLVYARTTMDYNDAFEEPEMETNLIGGYRTEYLSGPTYVIDPLSITDDNLFLFSSYPPEESIDIYEAKTGEYQYSISPPGEDSNGRTLTIQNDRIYETRDTTVTVWEIIY